MMERIPTQLILNNQPGLLGAWWYAQTMPKTGS
jgi:glucokinase